MSSSTGKNGNILAHSGSSQSVQQKDVKSNTSEKTKPILVGDNQLLEPNNLVGAKPSKCPRNPITGIGLNGDGVGLLKHKVLKDREGGNPVTGEGYRPGRTDYESLRRVHVRHGEFSKGRW